MPDPSNGQRQSRNAGSTREAILNASAAVFAEHGFDGARIDAIAMASGHNQSLIFRYFGDKVGLYAEVLRRADREMHELQAHLLATVIDGETTASLATAIRAIFEYLVDRPHFLRILTWEMAEGWQTSAKIISERDRADVEQLMPLLSNAHWAGRLRSGFIPVIQLTMVLQICQSYLAFLPLYQMLLPHEDVSSTEALAGAREYIVELLVHGMTVEQDRDTAGENPESRVLNTPNGINSDTKGKC